MLSADTIPFARHVDISAVLPVIDRFDDPEQVYFSYRDAMAAVSDAYELIYVLDGSHPWLTSKLTALAADGEPIRIIDLPRGCGEAACITVGVERAQSDRILLLPPYLQIEPAAIPDLVSLLQQADLVAPCRDRKGDLLVSRARGKAFEVLARAVGARRDDLGCHVRLFHRRVLDEIDLRHDQHRFLPILAEHAGFKVTRVMAPQATADRCYRHHGPRAYVGRVLDVVAMSFLLKFVQKPFRFFGAIGLVTIAIGLLIDLALAIDKLVYGEPIADRPALLLGTLFLVLGLQIAAVGLIAEIVIFTRSRARPTYRIDHVVEQPANSVAAE